MIELLLNAESQLALGLLDQAELTYRTVLEADPRNGIAATGLSRVALERGDEAGAHALARAALEIDPENATARRMIDRLEEVASYRDAGVSGRGTAGGARPGGGGAQAPHDAGAASQAMNPAFAVAETVSDPDGHGAGAPAARGDALLELAEAPPSPADPVPGGPVPATAVPGGSAAGRMHESSPHGRGPDREPVPRTDQASEPGPAPTAAGQSAPARPGLLRRILRRS